MIEIEKLRQGRKVSINEYNQAKLDFDDLYANASDDDKAKIDGLMRSSLNYSSANPMNNRSTREYQTLVYKNAAAILRGESTPSMAPSASTPNLFNGYSLLENQNNANYVTQRYLSHAGKSATAAASGPAQPKGLYYRYNWANGLSSGWTLDSDTLEDRMNSFAATLSNNLNSALSAKNSGKKIIGVDENNIEVALSMLPAEKKWTKDDFKDLMKVAQLSGVDPSTFRDYFGDLFPGASPIEKAKRARIQEGYLDIDPSELSDNVKKALGQNILLKHKDTGEYKLFNKDYSDYSGSAFDWIDLNQGDNYGRGIVVDNTGRAFLGDIRTIGEEGNAYKDLYDAALDRRKNYKNAFLRKKFNIDNDYSESNLINDFIKQQSELKPGIKDVAYTDVSKLFAGNNHVIAYKDDGTELRQGDFGELILDPNTKFMWQNADGTYGNGDFEKAKQAAGGFKHGGYDDEDLDQAGILYDTSNLFKGVEGISGDTNLLARNWKRTLEAGTAGAGLGALTTSWSGAGAVIGALGGFATGAVVDLIAQYYNNDSIANKPQAFVDSAIAALKNPSKKIKVQGVDLTGSQFLSQFGSREQLLATIGAFIQSKQVTLSPADKQLIRNLYMDINESSKERLRAHKLGGILLAADGDKLYPLPQKNSNNWHEKYDKSAALKKEDADIEKALQEGYKSAEHYRANKNTNLSKTDMMRIGTIAADITSIVASFTSATGGGAAVAEAAGLASFGIDTVADILDPSVSSGEVLKNGLINAGLAAVSFIPGARIPKTLAKITKYAPKVLLAASAMGMAMDESVLNTFKKVADGKEKLNTEDWRNIAHVFTLVAAGSRAGRQGYEKFRAKKDLTGKAKDMLSVKSGDTLIGEIAANKKSELDAIEQLAKDGVLEGENGAYKKLAKLLEKPEADVKQFFTQNGKLQKGKYSLNLKASEEKPGINIDEALEAFEDAKYSGNSNWSWLRNAPTWRLRGIMDATEIYPNGIIGNKRTDGVTERMRAKITKLSAQQESVTGLQSTSTPQSSPYPSNINQANNVKQTLNRLGYNGIDNKEIIPDSRALAIRSEVVSPASLVRERLAIPQGLLALPEGQRALPQNRMLPEGQKALPQNRMLSEGFRSPKTSSEIENFFRNLPKSEYNNYIVRTNDGRVLNLRSIQNPKGRLRITLLEKGMRKTYDPDKLAEFIREGRIQIEKVSSNLFKDGGKVNYQKLRK